MSVAELLLVPLTELLKYECRYPVDDVVRRRRYSDHFITMCVCGYVGVYVSTIKRKPLIGMI